MTHWYETLFTNYANNYDNEPFTQGTLNEVDFIEHEISFDKNTRILDIGCGTGRHDIELAKRGYNVDGIDLSLNMLNKAKEKAAKAGVKVNFNQADARTFNRPNQYNLVLTLCEGGFSLMETDEMNFAILKNAVDALKPGGKYIFTCLNALFPLYNSVKEFVDNGSLGTTDCNFDIMQFRDFSTYTIADDDGNEMILNCNERYYAPSEITFMLKQLGMKKIEIFGSGIGKYDRSVKLDTNHFEMLVIAEK